MTGQKYDDPARSQERIAWKGLNEAVQRDLLAGRLDSHKNCPPASAATLAAGAAWFSAYRERELHEGRAR